MVRGGKSQHIELPVSTKYPTLVTDLHGEYPPYFIYGPLVFSRATWQMISSVENNLGMLRALGFAKSPLITRAMDPPDAGQEELVVVSSPFFPHKLANGYSNPAGTVVYSVNGTRIMSLKHLVAVLRDLKDPFVTFEFDQRGGEALVFSRAEMVAATEGILADNGIRAQGSPDTLAVWQEKAAR